MNKKNVLTCTGGGGRLLSGKTYVTESRPAKCGTGSAGGFTMAEILLSLTIIGVVAAITLPSLTGNINERTWNTQRKALFARMSQAVSLMPALNGYGTRNETTENVAETFVTAGLSKVLKINNICDNEHLSDCGLPKKLTTLTGSVIDQFPKTFLELCPKFNFEPENNVNTYKFEDTKASGFETVNGESIALYYNPACNYEKLFAQTWGFVNSRPSVCANLIYDLNGNKGPNTVGKDIGVMTVLFASDSMVVAPTDFKTASSTNSAPNCKQFGEEYFFADAYNLIAYFVNSRLLLNEEQASAHVWASTKSLWQGQLTPVYLIFNSGTFGVDNSSARRTVFCMKRL